MQQMGTSQWHNISPQLHSSADCSQTLQVCLDTRRQMVTSVCCLQFHLLCKFSMEKGLCAEPRSTLLRLLHLFVVTEVALMHHGHTGSEAEENKSDMSTGRSTANLEWRGAREGWALTVTCIHMGNSASSVYLVCVSMQAFFPTVGRWTVLQCSESDPIPGWWGTAVFTDFSLEIQTFFSQEHHVSGMCVFSATGWIPVKNILPPVVFFNHKYI